MNLMQDRSLLLDAARRAADYLDVVQNRSVTPSVKAVAALEALHHPLLEGGCAAEEVLEVLENVVGPATTGMAGPRYFGFVIGGSLPATLAANWLASAWDQNAVFHDSTPGVAVLETVALDWMIELFGLPSTSGGAFVTGATMANFAGLAAARHQVLEAAGWNVEADGLFGAPEIHVIVGQEAHASLIKALGMLGLGRNRVLTVAADAQGRMRADALPPLEGPTIVCTQAGNVNSGAFDPIAEICELVRPYGAWVHVDGAFGLWAAADSQRAHLLSGVGEADSWATDAHKWLNVPYDCGVAFVRQPETLRSAMAVTADYLIAPGAHRDPSSYTPELSRRARGVEVWAALYSLGREGLRELIDGCCRHAQRFADGLQAAGYTVLNDVSLNQVLVSFGDNETTRQVIDAIQREGTCWCGGTVWKGTAAMRISVSSWATTESDVERSLEAMLRIAGQITGSSHRR